MFYRYIILPVVSLFLISSCEYQSFSGVPSKEFSALKDDIFSLRMKVAELSYDHKNQKSKQDALIEKMDSELKYIHEKLIEFQIDILVNKDVTKVVLNAKQDEGFQSLDSSEGKFLVSVKEVKPHLDGYKIMFTIGNPTNATFTNPTINLRWNKPLKIDWESSLDEPEKQAKEWQNSFKEKKFNLLRDFNRGSWSDVELFVTPCSTTELEYIEFSIEALTIFLYADTNK